MAAPSSQVFTGIKTSQFEKLSQRARAEGIDMSGPSGCASKLGVTVEWNYSEDRQELLLTCLKTPFFVSSEKIHAQIEALVNQALAS